MKHGVNRVLSINRFRWRAAEARATKATFIKKVHGDDDDDDDGHIQNLPIATAKLNFQKIPSIFTLN